MSSLKEQLSTVGMDKIPPFWDVRYLKNVDKLSKPRYKVKEERDVYITLPDGVKICADVFRPDVEGERFPALLAWASYGKSLQSIKRTPQPVESLVFDHTIEAGDIDYFVERGYTYVIPDPRGIGKSEGEWNGFYSPKEQEDIYYVIDWIAGQPWCSGDVGMGGLSYYGMIQLSAAAQQNPHLKAIMPISVNDDYYLHCYYGGILNTYYYGFLDLCPVNNGVSESESLCDEEELKQKMKERLEDPEINSISYFHKILTTWPPRFHTWFLDVLLHPFDGPFWHARSSYTKYDKVKIPVSLCGNWAPSGRYQPFYSFMDPKLDVPKKLTIFGVHWKILRLPYRFANEDSLRWYDHWLKGIDTGVMDEPPVKIFVRGVNRYRFENEWPLARTKWDKIYLRRFGKLETEPEQDRNITPDSLVHEPPDITTAVPSLSYSTDFISRPMEVTGPITLYLYSAIDQEDANFIAKLWDVLPNGEKIPLANGYLKASRRTLIEKKSKPYQPVHDHTKAVPIKPGEVNEYVIQMQTTSIVFQPGHRMELE
ncbi:MAG: CocE/NonD family hydrolase, partial [Deltaproteobacteria bacterium]|nr:CocE/NonD family hydrolase [Deltaproteobacteria bacterium]